MTMGSGLEVGLRFRGAVYPLHLFGTIVPTYVALLTLIVNIALACVLTVIFRTLGVADGIDQTEGSAYRAIA
jgi:SSS family solute:Na+ symporter